MRKIFVFFEKLNEISDFIDAGYKNYPRVSLDYIDRRSEGGLCLSVLSPQRAGL